MIVHDDIYDEVVERVVAIVAGMRCGDPFDPATVIGPVVTRDAQERILAMIDRAQADGAKLLAGGGRPRYLATASTSNPPCSATSTRPASSVRSRCSVRCSR